MAVFIPAPRPDGVSPPKPRPYTTSVDATQTAPANAQEYLDAFQVRACYERIEDAASDPLGLAISCDLPRAGYRFVEFTSGGQTCPIGMAGIDFRAGEAQPPPKICLEAVER